MLDDYGIGTDLALFTDTELSNLAQDVRQRFFTLPDPSQWINYGITYNASDADLGYLDPNSYDEFYEGQQEGTTTPEEPII